MTTREVILDRIEVDANGCWIWTGAVNKVLSRGLYGGKYAYRISYEVFVGPIPAGLQINHHCDVSMCVNPEHLYAGTQAENMRDCVARGRHTPPALRGEAQWMAYPDATVDEVRARYAGGELQKDLAAEYGISLNQVRRWCSGGDRGRTPIKRPRAACGTRAGYCAHISRKEPTCAPCREANTAYLRAYKAKRRADAA